MMRLRAVALKALAHACARFSRSPLMTPERSACLFATASGCEVPLAVPRAAARARITSWLSEQPAFARPQAAGRRKAAARRTALVGGSAMRKGKVKILLPRPWGSPAPPRTFLEPNARRLGSAPV